MDVHAEILNAAPNRTHVAAGDLHEEIWFELLKLEDPEFRNVRLTRGDGGIDGVTFLDPATGAAHVVQAKFFEDITDASHREAVASALLTAMRLSFPCPVWELLLPRQLSHTDLQWLMTEAKAAALAVLDDAAADALKAATSKGAAPKKITGLQRKHAEERVRIEARLKVCAVKYRDGDDLERLIFRHISIASSFLPNSSVALSAELEAERKRASAERNGQGAALEVLRQEAIRQRQVQARTAIAALTTLNQGWTNQLGSAQLLIGLQADLSAVTRMATDMEGFTERKLQQAIQAESLAPGVSSLVSAAHSRSRMLLQVAVVASVGADAEGALSSTIVSVISSIEAVQRCVGAAMRRAIPL